MLKAMNRRGTKEDVLQLMNNIRKTFDHPTLRTTFIVGFPQESEAQFEELKDFIKDAKWDRMGAFTYSREEDTPAYAMDGRIDEATQERRLQELMQLQETISLHNQQKLIGETIEVLVEAQDGLSGMYRGRGSSSAPDEVDGIVFFTSERAIKLGSFVYVKITEAMPHDVKGEEVVFTRV